LAKRRTAIINNLDNPGVGVIIYPNIKCGRSIVPNGLSKYNFYKYVNNKKK
jgi:hypothetical protein